MMTDEADLSFLALQCFHLVGKSVSMIAELGAHWDARRIRSTQALASASFALVQPNKTLQAEKITAPS